jgi:hypothetical protein
MARPSFAHGIIVNGLQKFRLSQDDSKAVVSAEAPISIEANTYLVVLVNTSNICITRGRTRPVGQTTWGGWFATQTICHNCDHTYDQCVTDHDFGQVMSTNCNAAPFELMLIETPDNNGNANGAVWTVTPNCAYAGGAIGLS